MRGLRLWLAVGAVLGLAGCAGGSDCEEGTHDENDTCVPDEESLVDIRAEFPAPQDGGQQFLTPDLEIEPYEEIMYCYYDTYVGPAAGVVGLLPMYSRTYVHHLLLRALESDETPDGTLEDCTVPNENQMVEPVFLQEIQMFFPDGSGDWLSLLPGYAFRIEENQKLKLDVHFVNPTQDALLANVAVNLELIPEEEVEVWLGGFELDKAGLELAPGERTTASFDCPMPAGSSILSLGGHMHSSGEAFRVELVRGEEVTRLYDVPDWLPEYRFASPRSLYFPGQVQMEEGDLLRTTCTWNNETDQVLTFPDEMCTTFGVATDIMYGLICENGEVN